MSHPYRDAPADRFWRKAVALPGIATDPVTPLPFRISPTDRIMTAGSCFAQHISRHLRKSGFDFLVTEPAHPLLPDAVAEAFHYGRFTARYGNIYTARQLLQLLHRAEGRLKPLDGAWKEDDGRWIDPLRPLIHPGGFASLEELERDRTQHLVAVMQAFERLDVLVFTLGLTESWVAAMDGTVYPACPGTAGGRFDASLHHFHNQSAGEVIADLTDFINGLRRINPRARVILTVSPVPLVATATDRHVLQATSYSKAVLRVAAESVAITLPDVAYFPSYEIITGPQARGHYFADDLRSVTDEGVDRVMNLFFAHAVESDDDLTPLASRKKPSDEFFERAHATADLLCDEEKMDERG